MDFKNLRFQQSRIPKLDALSAFVPTGNENDPVITEAHAQAGFSRWCPVDGGHRVLFLHEGGDYDSSRFTLVCSGS